MSKDVLIILHGIGEHTADSFEKEVVDAANNAIQRYDSYKQLKYEYVIEVISIGSLLPLGVYRRMLVLPHCGH